MADQVTDVGILGSHNPKLTALRILDRKQFTAIVEKVIRFHHGDLASAARHLKVGYTTIKRWRRESPELDRAVIESREAAKTDE